MLIARVEEHGIQQQDILSPTTMLPKLAVSLKRLVLEKYTFVHQKSLISTCNTCFRLRISHCEFSTCTNKIQTVIVYLNPPVSNAIF